jgi:tetratricopeptide (TPR) repeat protein
MTKLFLIKLDQNNSLGFNGKGLCLQYLNRTNEAIECFNESVRLDPTQPNYYFSKGFNLKALNNNA